MDSKRDKCMKVTRTSGPVHEILYLLDPQAAKDEGSDQLYSL